MSYYLTDPYYYLPKTYPYNNSDSKSLTYQGQASNRMGQRNQYLENQSILRRMKVSSELNNYHRNQQIQKLKLNCLLQSLQGTTNLQKFVNNQRFAEIKGCRNNKNSNIKVKGHQFPYFIQSFNKK